MKIHRSELLKGIKIVDLSHRLPGPLSGYVLSLLGAEVIKCEDHQFQDAFLSGLFAKFDSSFQAWYESLNALKTLKRYNFKTQGADIRKLIEDSDAVIMGAPPKVREQLGLTDDDFKNWKNPLAIISIGSTEDETLGKQSMHDLNAMAISGLMSLYINDHYEERLAPPFLPVSGIAVGQHTASAIMAAILKSKKENKVIQTETFLYETAKEIFTPFWPQKCRDNKETLFLHNGAYPCYNLYLTKDKHYVALAAVEEKFWKGCQETFKIDLAMENRFDRTAQAYQKCIDIFKNLNADEIEAKCQGLDLCVSVIRRL